MALSLANQLVHLHVRKVRQLLKVTPLTATNQPQFVTQILILDGDLKVLDLYTLMILLELEEILSQLQIRLKDFLDHIDRENQAICHSLPEDCLHVCC